MFGGLVIILTLAAGANVTDAHGIIDLTNAPSISRRFTPSSSTISGILSGATGQTTPGSLSLSLVRADVDNDKNVVYEVKLTNSGPQSECIPIDPMISDIEPKEPAPYSYRGATISLIANERVGTQPLETITLVDDEGHHHCRLLLTKTSLIFRAKTKLHGPMTATPLNGKVGIQVLWSSFVAHVSLSQGQFSEELSSGQPVKSVNTLEVCVTGCTE